MNILGFIPVQWKLIGAAIGILLLLGMIGAGIGVIEKHGEQKATQLLQPKIDAANAKIGSLVAANQTDQETIRAFQVNEQANDDLIAALQHQTDEDARVSTDAGKQIRSLQNVDADVAAFLGTAIPCGLRSVLNGSPGSGDAACVPDQNSHAAAAVAK